jgi:ABC-type sugar transport system ATPase subunit
MSERVPFLSVSHLRKAYLETQAVDDVSFEVAGNAGEGEIIGLVGKNGAGKSTVIKMLAGVVTPDAGEIAIDGEPVAFRNPQHPKTLGLAFMHQELEQLPRMSVAENVILGSPVPRRFGVLIDWRRLNAISREITDLLNLDLDPEASVDGLSVAEKRLLMIGRALHTRAKLLVLDEPSASLTGREIEHLHEICGRIKARGGSIIYVSHRLQEILDLTDRVIVMRDGRLVEEGPTSGFDQQSLVRAIIGAADQSLSADQKRLRSRGDLAVDSPVVLETEGLTRGTAVRGVSLKLRRGEVLGIAGLVGAGRTELARLIFGADRRDSGTIKVNGETVAPRSPREAIRAGIALLPEDRRNEGLVLDFGVRANVTLAALDRFTSRLRLFPSRRRESRQTAEMIERLDIVAADQEMPVRYLSGGNQQKAVLGKWLTRGADAFIFDEPTAGIDVDAKAQIYDLARALAAEGKGILFISSEFAELTRACDRVVVMREGQLVGDLSGSEMTEENMVALCYGR